MHEYPALQNYPLYIEHRKTSKYFSIFNENAENVVVALLAKQFPIFTYTQPNGVGEDEYVKVIASAIKFSSSYDKFLSCRDQLLPYALSSFQDKFFYYPEGRLSVLSSSFPELDKIGTYLKVLPESKLVLVSETSELGKLDSKLFKRRASRIKAYLVKKGIKSSRISVKPSFPIVNIKTQINIIRTHIFAPDILKKYKYKEGRFYLSKRDKQRLNLVAKYMLSQTKPLVIDAHSDRTASRKNYKRLSQQRGDKVKKYLLAQGLSENKVIVRAYGTSRPLATNRTREGRAMNRRIILSFPF
jgi:outer membrane protein OmpA-like peptidoglycan-associated protein